MGGANSYPNRRSIRLQHLDYSQPAIYFVTLCTLNRECLFSTVMNGRVCLTEFGRPVEEEWLKSERIRPTLHLDAFVIMPNHLHGLVRFGAAKDSMLERAHGRAPLQAMRNASADYQRTFGGREQRSLSSFVAAF